MIADDKKDKEAIVMSKRLVAFFSAAAIRKRLPRHWQKQQEQICMRSHREWRIPVQI